MSKYHYGFRTDTVGSNVAGLTIRGGGTPTYKKQYAAKTVVPVHRAYLEFLTDNTGDYRCVSIDALDADTNRATCNIVIPFAVDLTTVEEIHVYVRGQGTGTVTDFGRIRLKMSGANNLNVDHMVASAYTAGIASATVALTAGNAYFLRVEATGTTLRARVFNATAFLASLNHDAEPTAWDVSGTVTPTAAGWIAFGGRHSTLTAKVACANTISVGTNGDAAIAPRTNAERTAWLKDPTARRVCLAKLAFTKYVSSPSPYTGTGYWYISDRGYTSQEQDSPARQAYPALITKAPSFSRQIDVTLRGQVRMNIGDMEVMNPGVNPQHIENRILRACAFDNASWSGTASVSTAAATPPPGRDRADQLTDSSAVAFEPKAQSCSVPADTATWYIAIDVKKTSGGTAPTFGMNISITGGTSVSRTPRLNTDSGATASTGVHSVVPVTASDGTEYWRLTASIPNNGSASNTTLSVTIYPAVAPAGLGSDSAATTGSAIVSGAWIYRDPQAVYGNTNSVALDVRSAPGSQDDILRMRWLRNLCEIQYGDPDWPQHDFFTLMVARLEAPTSPSEGRIRFRFSDLSDFLNAPIQTTKFTTGARTGEYKPKLLGRIDTGQIEPPESDETTDTFTLSDAAITDTVGIVAPEPNLYVTDDGVQLVTGTLTVSAVNTGTDTLTFSAAHGLKVDALVYGVTLPAPLADATAYYVKTVPSTTEVTLAATRGGATINITGSTTGGQMYGANYVFDGAAATLRLLTPNVGRVLVGFVKDNVSGSYVDEIYSAIVFTAMGLSLNYKDAASFSAMNTICSNGAKNFRAGLWLDTTLHTAKQACDMLAEGTGSWYGFTPDGLLQVGFIGSPAATAVRSFAIGDVPVGTASIKERIRAIDFSAGLVTAAPWFVTRGPVPFVSPLWSTAQGEQLSTPLSPYSYGAAGIPLDDHPDQRDADKTFVWRSVFNGTGAATARRTELVSTYKSDAALFSFPRVKHHALECELGETVSVEYPRLGFKAWTASDPPSPDNVAAVDSRLAVVVGAGFDLNNEAFPASLVLFRPLPGYYPTSNLN